jgi:hypothetical protein
MKAASKKILAGAAAFALVLAVTPARAVGGVDLSVTKFALEKGVFNTMFAKEYCSCQFVDGLTLDDCKAHDNVPSIAHKLVNIRVDPNAHTVTSTYLGHDTINAVTETLGLGDVAIGGSATARFDDAHPEYGCVLTHIPSEP